MAEKPKKIKEEEVDEYFDDGASSIYHETDQEEESDLQIQNSFKSHMNPVLKDDMITNYFRGKIRRIITFDRPDGRSKVKEKIIDSFAAILIRVIGFKDLYTAWEDQVVSVIDDYKVKQKRVQAI